MRHLALLLACLAVACSFQLGSSTPGNDHRATFSYGSCFFGCSLDQAMMVGTQEVIHVEATSIPSLSIDSSAPNVVAVQSATRSCCVSSSSSGGTSGTCRMLSANDVCAANESGSLDVTVDAKIPGSAALALVASDGSTFDLVSLTVAKPVALAFKCDNKAVPSTLAVSQSCVVGWTATDANGHALMATTGVTLTSSDVNVLAFQQLLSKPAASVEASQGFLAAPSLVAMGVGDATITGTADQVSSGFFVHVK